MLFAVILLAVAGGAALATKWYLDRRATERAEVQAATDEVRIELRTLYEALAESTQNGADAAASLRVTLQEHLTVSERTDEELATDRDLQQAALTDAAERLRTHASADPPEIPELADAGALEPEVERLREHQETALRLADDFEDGAARAQRWAQALTELRAAADRYVETVEGQPDTHDPERLQRLWREERDILMDYREAAQRAEEVEGLAPLAQAYLDYIDANLAFVDEVIALLEQEEIDAYNRRLDEVFEEPEDPFGFQAAVTDATEQSLDAGVIAGLAETRQRAVEYLAELQAAAAALDPSPAPVPTPAGR